LSGLKAAAAAASNKSSLAAQSSEWFHLSGGSSSGSGSGSGNGKTVRNAKIVKKVKPANHVTTSLVNTPAFAPCNGSGAGASLANRPGLEPCNGSTTAVVQSESSSTSLAAPRSAPVGLSVHSAARAAVSAVSKAASSLTSAMKGSASSRNTNVGDAARAGLALQGRATPDHGLLSSTANGHAIQASSHQANVESHMTDASAAADNARAADADRTESLATPDAFDGAPNSAKAGLAVQGRPRNLEVVSGNDATALPSAEDKTGAWAWRKAQMMAKRRRKGRAALPRNMTVSNSTKQNQQMQWAQPENNAVNQIPHGEAPEEAMTANANHDAEVARADKDTHSAARYQGGQGDGVPRPPKSRQAQLDEAHAQGIELDDSDSELEARLSLAKEEVFNGSTFHPQGRGYWQEIHDRFDPRPAPQAPPHYGFSGVQTRTSSMKQARHWLWSRYQPYGENPKDEYSIDSEDLHWLGTSKDAVSIDVSRQTVTNRANPSMKRSGVLQHPEFKAKRLMLVPTRDTGDDGARTSSTIYPWATTSVEDAQARYLRKLESRATDLQSEIAFLKRAQKKSN